MFNVNPSASGYTLDRSSRIFRQVLERMAAVPGVTSVALTRAPLLSGTAFNQPAWKQGQTSLAPAEQTMFNLDVSPAFFATMGIPVLQGRGEIGVRMALGAQRSAVIGMVMRESSRLVAIGIVVGLAAVLWASRFVQTVVYGVSPSDPLTIGVAVALVAGLTALAGGLPARRASNVNPIEALRQQ
jgi:hypothetical protein